ncbi:MULTISPECIES: formate--phosphoribosylaminoimidazolecarboxamide ligase family protein [unclassified Archaeoglobus]|jgi:5-formaminoimidazole-4-carboxamide-1-(beta)-D-ribofuranosyl 5'-monophosphate synthetase|uniref:formate--phosphoribosylaminoimidazolecarboxamide ligase family protein n=1 Tax=unclassified Archaeoglobus TaxID=2643606 RepID=UPI0025B9C23B|nr:MULTISPECIES: formate--phosphoribosylaminoimidazolecarboxamide ligase family protein [unclassified Archaeoglobus]
MNPQKIAENYEDVTIGIFGSHSAKEVGMAAKAWGFRTVVVVQKGRDKLYTKYNRHLYDEVIMLDNFRDMLDKEVQERLVELNTIFIPNRSFAVYVGYDGIENVFEVPIYGNRYMLRAEERNYERNQYYLLEKAGLRYPKEFESPEEIDRLVVVKVQQAKNPLERAFFYANSPEDYYRQAEELLKAGVINEEGLKKARIEEYVLGARFNANFHSYALKDIFGDFDFVGFSDRRQVNLQGFLNLPAKDQLKINVPVKNEEIGHFGVTMRESKQQEVYEACEKFLRACERELPPGIIGMFGLQGAMAYSYEDETKLEFVIFDVSFRVPGDPAIGPTSPEMRNLSLKHGVRIEDPLDLTMMEIKKAVETGRIKEIVT